jgi:hypothetical protein
MDDKMKLLADVVKRAEEKQNAVNATHVRKEEVEQLFLSICYKHMTEFKSIFKVVETKDAINNNDRCYGALIRIADRPTSWSSDGWKIAISDTYNRKTWEKDVSLRVGYNAGTYDGKKIPFDYNQTDVQLTLLFENALRLLASMKLNRMI